MAILVSWLIFLFFLFQGFNSCALEGYTYFMVFEEFTPGTVPIVFDFVDQLLLGDGSNRA